MTALIIFIGLIFGLNCIPLLITKDFPKTKKAINTLLITSTILFLTFTLLMFFGYRLKGIHSFTAMGFMFIGVTLLYFAIFKNTPKKILTTALLTPILLVSIYILLFRRTLKEFKLDEKYNVAISNGGPLACGESLKISRSAFLIFYKEVYGNDNTCLKGISKIETIFSDDKQVEILIYHDGEFDSENPYKETIEKNGW